MADDLLDTYIQQLLTAHPGPEVTIAWQGGEPTMMGLDFFRRSVDLVERNRRPNQRVAFSIQTNGTLLSDEWAEFLKDHDFLVGVSIDGPQHLHDAYRVDKRGNGSFDRVISGYELLYKHGIDVNILCAVHAANQHHPVEAYRFFRDELEARFIQFIPVVERVTETLLPLANLGWSTEQGEQRPLYVQAGHSVTDRSVDATAFGEFLNAVFDEWLAQDMGHAFVQHFDVALAAWHGMPGELCIFSATCGQSLAIEHNGDVYSCDHYVEPDYLLGNIDNTPLADMITSEQQVQFGIDKRSSLPEYCRQCDVRFACNGGCPKNRFTQTPDGEDGLNYLCPSYKAFFCHIDEPMRVMSDLLTRGRAPAETPNVLEAQQAHATQPRAKNPTSRP